MDLSKCHLDYLPGSDIYYYQHPDMFHTNTDTALLGQFADIRKRDTVLDIGTNNGALLLYAMQKKPKHLIGVDINEEACQLAGYNLNHYHHAQAEIFACDILQFTHQPVSCIVCNPPYFKVSDEKQLNHREPIANARHEAKLTLDALLKKASELLVDKGRLYLIHRSDRLIDLAISCRMNHMEIKKIQLVYDEAKSDAQSVLIEAMKSGKSGCRILPIHMTRR